MTAEQVIARRALDIPDTVRTRPPSQDAFTWQHCGENKDINPFPNGAAVALHPAGGCIMARASAPIRLCIGLAQLGAGVGHSELVQWEGQPELFLQLVGKKFQSEP